MSEEKVALKRRLRTIAGHIQAVERMVDEDKYCIDIIHQTQAIKKAIDRVEEAILGNHLNHCVTTAIRSADEGERQRVIEELLEVFNAKNRL